MLAAIAVLALAPLELPAVADAWVYSHAGDPANDLYVRCWGGDEGAVGTVDATGSNFSYSLLKFDASSVQGEIASAKLVLWHAPKPAFSAEESKESPLEARSVKGTFDERNWSFAKAATALPNKGETGLYGEAVVVPGQESESAKVEIDLLPGKGGFAKSVQGQREFTIALTSRLNPESAGQGKFYKLFSRHSEKAEMRPKLVIQMK